MAVEGRLEKMYNFRDKRTSFAYEFFSGALGLIFAKGNGNFSRLNSQTQKPGGEGMLKFQIDWYIIHTMFS